MKRFSSFTSAALTVLLLMISVMPASAATSNILRPAPTQNNPSAASSSGLSIEPRKNYVIQPGQTINDKITVGNLDRTNSLKLHVKAIDFTYTDQSGTPKLFLAANAPQTAWSLKPYIKLPGDTEMGPSQTKTLNYSLTIPKNLGAGSYYSAIMYQSDSGTGGNVGLGASGVTLVFVSVPGAVDENMQLQKFGAYSSNDNGVTGGYVYIATKNPPQLIAYTLKNAGNVVESPAGSITLKNMFGKQVGSVNKTNIAQSLALEGQSRLFTSCIEDKSAQIVQLGGRTTSNTSNQCITPRLSPGLYTAKLDVFYGQNGNQTHEITSTAHFWYLPVWFILIAIVVLILIGLGIWILQRKLRSLVKGNTYHSGTGISRKKN